MNRRAGGTDRHALLAGGAYPSSSSLSAYRSASPFEQPYGSSSNFGSSSNGTSMYGNGYSAPSASDYQGAPKKEPPPLTNGNSLGGGGAGNGFLGRMAAYAGTSRTAEDLEEQNDQKLEGLSARVSMLKEITLNIGTEVRDSTKDMGSLSEAFSNTGAFLGGTMSRMNKMAKRQGGWFCNMMLFLLFVTWIFVFLWWWRR